MPRAGPANGLELFPQCSSGAVQPDSGVVGGDACRPGCLRRTRAFQVDAPEEVGVLGLERLDDAAHARADRTEQILVLRFGLLVPQALLLDLLAAVGVDERVAQKPVEPGYRTLIVSDRVRLLQGFYVGRLEGIARGFFGAEPRAQESKEFALAIQQDLRDVRGLVHVASVASHFCFATSIRVAASVSSKRSVQSRNASPLPASVRTVWAMSIGRIHLIWRRCR